ncbi:MAG TPA: hypothetical protein VIS52_08425, partial [Motiliproteus sp.]
KQQIRQDRHLRWMMHAGIPIALIAIVSLWLGQTLGSRALGMLFVVSLPAALLLGLAYNIRYLMLANRLRDKDKN